MFCDYMDLKLTQRILKINFFLMVSVALLLVALYEFELLVPTELAGDANLVFMLQMLMELITILTIPVALKLFSLKLVRRRLLAGKGDALLCWGTARLNMLCLPMLVNVFLYYQVMWAGFGYMAIILFLCLFFVYPSMDRCVAETEEEHAEQHNVE